MNNIIPFPNPPITEALLDIRVNFREINLDRLALVLEEIKAEYPIKKERYGREGQLQFKPGYSSEIVSSTSEIDGYWFTSTDGKKIVQARKDGFTFNKLKPYSNWESFSKEAKEAWQYYSKITKPINVLSVALRYINRIEIPLPFQDFKEYIRTIPEVAPGIPNRFENFFTQLVIPHPELQSTTAIITETIEQVYQRGFLPLIFDIDVTTNKIFQPDSDDIWEAVGKLRSFKNQIFINSITEKTMELFK